METIIYVIIFIIGCFFGSFFTLAVYRIPRKEDIFIKHSYCPNCNHRLGFFDLFPVLSYIFLKGKCRYCNNPIRIRYLLLEIFSGLVFLLLAISMKINITNLNGIYLFSYFIYISILFIIAGIDKELHNIDYKVLCFGFSVEFIYIIYKCTLNFYNVYQYVIYIVFLIILLSLMIINLKRRGKVEYYVQILFLSLYIVFFIGSINYILTVIFTLLLISFSNINKKQNLPIGYYIVISNVCIMLISNFICNFII